LEAQYSLQVLHTEARVHVGGKKSWIAAYRCPHCSNSIQSQNSYDFKLNDKITDIHVDTTCYKCPPCGITFYDDKTIVDIIISRRIDDAIRNIINIPEKTIVICVEPQKTDDDVKPDIYWDPPKKTPEEEVRRGDEVRCKEKAEEPSYEFAAEELEPKKPSSSYDLW